MCVWLGVGDVSESFRLGSTWAVGRVEHLERGWKHISSPCSLPCASLPSSCPELQSFTINQGSNKWNVFLSSVSHSRKFTEPKEGSGGNAGDPSWTPELGRSPGEGNGNPFQYSCQKIPWTEEPGRLQSLGSQRVQHVWETNTQVTTWTCDCHSWVGRDHYNLQFVVYRSEAQVTRWATSSSEVCVFV